MICVIRAEDTIEVDGLTVPDAKFGQGDNWGVYEVPGQPAFIYWFDRPSGERVSILWFGPYLNSGPNNHTIYFCDVPRKVLQRLKNQLGDAAVTRLKAALRNRRWLRRLCRDNGFRIIKRPSDGANVGVYPPLVICGRNPIELDDQSIEDADALADLEN